MKNRLLRKFKVTRLRGFLTLCLLMIVLTVQGQDLDVSGTVTDANGPLPGASVVVKGTKKGTQADFDGNFTLSNVASDATLVLSYIGYKSIEAALNGRTSININLQEDAQALDEVVVLGYSTVKKSDLTGAVQQISADDLAEIPSSNITSLLAGRLSGVTITNSNGAPGSAPNILVRGVRSVKAGNAPLVVVDGSIYNGNITDINPLDIEFVNVLKYASSTVIYGFRNANGVNEITTNQGKTDNLNVSIYYAFGAFKAMPLIDMQSSKQQSIAQPRSYRFSFKEPHSLLTICQAQSDAKTPESAVSFGQNPSY